MGRRDDDDEDGDDDARDSFADDGNDDDSDDGDSFADQGDSSADEVSPSPCPLAALEETPSCPQDGHLASAEGDGSDEDDEDDEDEEEEDDDEEEEAGAVGKEAGAGMGEAMAKILATKVTGETAVLAKRKTPLMRDLEARRDAEEAAKKRRLERKVRTQPARPPGKGKPGPR